MTQTEQEIERGDIRLNAAQRLHDELKGELVRLSTRMQDLRNDRDVLDARVRAIEQKLASIVLEEPETIRLALLGLLEHRPTEIADALRGVIRTALHPGQIVNEIDMNVFKMNALR